MRFSLDLSVISLLITILFCILPLTNNTLLAQGALLFVIFLIFLVFSIFKNNVKSNNTNLKDFQFLFFCFMGCSVLSLVNDHFQLRTGIRFIQFFSCGITFMFGMLFPFKEKHFALAHLVLRGLIIVCLLHWFFTGGHFSNYAFIYRNPNSLGTFLLCWFGFLSVKRLIKHIDIFFLAVVLFLCFISSSRASSVAILVYIGLYCYFKMSRTVVNRSISTIYSLYFVEMLSILIFILFSYALVDTATGNQLQELSRIYFGKNFFSGRQLIWGYLLDLVAIHPFIGNGLSSLPEDFLPFIQLSSHNGWLQIVLQIGIIGLMVMVLIIKKILYAITFNDNIFLSCRILPFVYAIIFHECFEVSLTQNLLVSGLMMWFVMGLGCNQNMHYVKNTKL